MDLLKVQASSPYLVLLCGSQDQTQLDMYHGTTEALSKYAPPHNK